MPHTVRLRRTKALHHGLSSWRIWRRAYPAHCGRQDYFREAICCLKGKLYRSAIVVAWAGYFHVFSGALYNKHETAIRVARPKWSFKDMPELRDAIGKSHLLIVAKDVKFITKAQLRIYDGQLSERNQCAHPTLYRPSMNAGIGYVDAMIRQTISCLEL